MNVKNEFTRVEIALLNRLFPHGGEFYTLDEIKNELTEFSDTELMRGLNIAVKKGVICVTAEAIYFR